jgi:hypothetical protein
MQSHLFVGGAHDGLSVPVADDQLEARIPVGATGFEVYIRDTLALGALASFTFYRHEELTPEEVIDLLAKHYLAWCVNMPGGRR